MYTLIVLFSLVLFGVGFYFAILARGEKIDMPFTLNKHQFKDKPNQFSNLLPWLVVGYDGTILQKDGLLSKVVAFRGPDTGVASDVELQYLADRVNNILLKRQAKWAYHFEAQRFEIRDYVKSEYDSLALKVIDNERAKMFTEKGKFYDSNYYITITYLPPKDRQAKLAKFVGNSQNKRPLYLKELEFFEEEFQGFLSELRNNCQVERLDGRQTLSFLNASTSWSWQIFENPAEKGVLMFANELLGMGRRLQVGSILKLNEKYTSVLAIVGFPNESVPGILDKLNHLNLEYRWVTRWIGYETFEGIKQLKNWQNKFFSERKSFGDSFRKDGGVGLLNTGALAQQAEVETAMQDVQLQHVGVGKLNSNIQVWGDTKEDLAEKLKAVQNVISECYFQSFQEDLNVLNAWKSMLPGEVFSNIRRTFTQTGAVSHILPMTAVWKGQTFNKFTNDVASYYHPLLITKTSKTTPFYWSLNIDDIGHGAIWGRTGSGKSMLISFLIVSFLKYPNSRVICFDIDKSQRNLALITGAVMYEPGVGSITFQPLEFLDTPEDVTWCTNYIELLLDLQNVAITTAMSNEISTALKQLSRMKKEQRTLSTLSQNLTYKDKDGVAVLQAGLFPYLSGNTYGDMFDSSHGFDMSARYINFEMRTIVGLGDKATIPAFAYIFRMVEKSLDGNLTFIPIDEAWLFIKHQYFANGLRDWFKTFRKHRGMVWTATQEISDVFKAGDVTDTIIANCLTNIFLPSSSILENVAIRDAYLQFGLTEAEVVALGKGQAKKEYFYKSELGKKMFDLNLGPKTLALLEPWIKGDRKLRMDQWVKDGLTPDEIAEKLLLDKGLDVA